MKCEKCPLQGSIQVETDGPKNCDLFVIQEAPGEDELQTGIPSSGRAGQLLRGTLSQLGIEAPTIGNVTQCRPPGVEALEAECRLACHSRLMADIEEKNPRLILALGAPAAKSLVGLDKVMEHVGEFHNLPNTDIKVLVGLNPAFHLRSLTGEGRSLSVNDLYDTCKLAMKFLGGEVDGETHRPMTPLLVDNIDDFLGAFESLGPKKSLDLETSGFDPISDKIMILIISDNTHSILINWEGVDDELFKVIKEVIEHNDFTMQNGRFDVEFLRIRGIHAKIHRDTFLERYTIDETNTNAGLKARAKLEFGAPDWEKEVKTYAPKKTDSYSKVPRDILLKYAGYDGIYTNLLAEVNDRDLVDNNRWLLEHILLPIVEVFIRVRVRGIPIEPNLLLDSQKGLKAEVDELDDRMRKLANEPLNISAPLDVARALFGIFAFPTIMGNSTDRKKVLDKILQSVETKRDLAKAIEGKIDSIEDLLSANIDTWREILEENYSNYLFLFYLILRRDKFKTLTTYLGGLAKNIKKDCRIHPVFNPTGTVGGRATGSNPYLLNIKPDPLIKRCFEPFSIQGDIWDYLYSDQSQFELRAYAAVSQDRGMIGFFAEQARNAALGLPTIDIHDFSRDRIAELTGLLVNRVIAKKFVFGPLYGMEDRSIALDLGLPEVDGLAMGAAVRSFFPGSKEYAFERLQEAITTNQLVTPFGRIRHYPYLDDGMLWKVKTQAANLGPQSVANDLNYLSLIELEDLIEKGEVNMETFFPVHDSISAGGPPSETEANKQAMEEVMSGIGKKWLPELFRDIPLVPKIKVGNSWEEADPSEKRNKLSVAA